MDPYEATARRIGGQLKKALRAKLEDSITANKKASLVKAQSQISAVSNKIEKSKKHDNMSLSSGRASAVTEEVTQQLNTYRAIIDEFDDLISNNSGQQSAGPQGDEVDCILS